MCALIVAQPRTYNRIRNQYNADIRMIFHTTAQVFANTTHTRQPFAPTLALDVFARNARTRNARKDGSIHWPELQTLIDCDVLRRRRVRAR